MAHYTRLELGIVDPSALGVESRAVENGWRKPLCEERVEETALQMLALAGCQRLEIVFRFLWELGITKCMPLVSRMRNLILTTHGFARMLQLLHQYRGTELQLLV